MPVSISGALSVMMPGATVSALGIRLTALSIKNGETSRIPTIPQRATTIRPDTRLSSGRSSSTATTSQLAAMLRLSTVRKN